VSVHKLGKRPFVPDPRDLKYADVRPKALPPIPAPHGGFGGAFPAGGMGWRMLGNGPCDDGSVPPSWYAAQGAGDCAWAAPGHEEMEAAINAKRPVPVFTSLNILNQYAQYLGLSGAEALNENNDDGSNIRDVLKWRQKTGLLDAAGTAHKIGTYISVDATDQQELWEGLWLFECVDIGINFPESAMTQFDNGEPWSVISGSALIGGHCIPLVGHPVEDTWTCVTWAKRQVMTANFLATYCDEAWAYIDPARYNAITGLTLEGYDAAELTAYLPLLAASKA